jgi:hypothetical protein
MENSIIEELREIVIKINRYFNIYKHNITLNSNIISINYEYHGYFYPDNLLRTYDVILLSKIYKYKDVYWEFGPLQNIEIYNIDNVTYIKFDITVNSFNILFTYFNFIPKEIVDIISTFLGITDINNFCTYMRTWQDYCDDRLYHKLYIDNYPEFYTSLKPFLEFDNNTWRNRYNSLLWEDVNTLNELYRKYNRVKPTSSHIDFILNIHNFYKDPNYNIVINLYKSNLKLLQTLFKFLPADIKNFVVNKLSINNRNDIILSLNNKK